MIKADKNFKPGDKIRIYAIDTRAIKAIRHNDWTKEEYVRMFDHMVKKEPYIYPTVLKKEKNSIIIGFRTVCWEDNYYIIKVPIKSIVTKIIDTSTDFKNSIYFDMQSYFYLMEDTKFVYLISFYYYENTYYKEVSYKGYSYQELKLNQNFISDFLYKLIVRVEKNTYYKKAVPIFDPCELLERDFINSVLKDYITENGNETIKDITNEVKK